MGNRSDDRHTGEGDADFDEGASTDPPAAKRSRFERIRGSVQSANIDPGTSDVSTKWSIDRLDEREKRFSFAAAGGAALFGVIIYLSETSAHKVLAKGQVSPQTTLTFGLVSAALLLIGTFVGRRAPVGFVALFTFLAFGSYLFLGLPFLALAAWLLYRSWKIQRTAAANVRSARARSGSGSPTTRGTPASAKAKGPVPKGDRRKGPVTPEANKRFTPKRPPPPAPKPTRRERKAAQASD